MEQCNDRVVYYLAHLSQLRVSIDIRHRHDNAPLRNGILAINRLVHW